MKLLKVFAVCILVLGMSTAAMADTLADVKAKGFVQVGVNGDLFGFGKADEKGVWKGLDVDCARAVAVSVFGKARYQNKTTR